MPEAKTHEKEKEIQLVLFKLGREEFGADISSVLEISRILEITHLPQAPGFIEGVVNLRGKVVPVVDLRRQFGMTAQTERTKNARIILVDIHKETVGFLVDEVPEVLRLPESSLEAAPELIQSNIKKDYVKGIGKLGSRLILLLDWEKILAPQEIGGLHGKNFDRG